MVMQNYSSLRLLTKNWRGKPKNPMTINSRAVVASVPGVLKAMSIPTPLKLAIFGSKCTKRGLGGKKVNRVPLIPIESDSIHDPGPIARAWRNRVNFLKLYLVARRSIWGKTLTWRAALRKVVISNDHSVEIGSFLKPWSVRKYRDPCRWRGIRAIECLAQNSKILIVSLWRESLRKEPCCANTLTQL